MKKLLGILVLFLLSAFVSYSQKMGTYTGKITLFEDIPLIKLYPALEYEPGKELVDISYQYYVNSKGDRVRHGQCKISLWGSSFDTIAIEGKYLNDKKTGQWKFTRVHDTDQYYAVISFNGDGEMDGPVRLYVMLDMFYSPTIEGYFRKGIPISLQIQWAASHKIGISGTFRFDEYGLLDGDCRGCTCDLISKPFKLKYCHGTLVHSEEYDDSTGKTSVVDNPIKIDSSPKKELKLEDGSVFYLDDKNNIYKAEKKSFSAVRDNFNYYVLDALAAIGFESKNIKGQEYLDYVPAAEHYKAAKLRIEREKRKVEEEKLVVERDAVERLRDSVNTDIINVYDRIDEISQLAGVNKCYAKLLNYSLSCFLEVSGAYASIEKMSELYIDDMRTSTHGEIVESSAVLNEVAVITAHLKEELDAVATIKSVMTNSKLKRKDEKRLADLVKNEDSAGVCEFWRDIADRDVER